MGEYLTAKDMRDKSSEKNVERRFNDLFDKIYKKIEHSAFKNEHSVVIYTREFANYIVKTDSDTTNTIIADNLLNKFKELGYQVEEKYRDLSSVVDMKLIISW